MSSAVLESSSSFGWLSPRISFSRDFLPNQESTRNNADQDNSGDFEFRLEDPPKKMLDADQLFSDGKLVTSQPAATTKSEENHDEIIVCKIIDEEISPKAPKCTSSRWKEFLGLKKNKLEDLQKSASMPSSKSSKSFKSFLHRNSIKSSSSSSSFDSTSMNFPLLKDFDTESVSISSRLSLSSSSSSSHEHEDLPRLSLDSEKLSLNLFPLHRNPPRVKLTKQPKPKAAASRHTTTSRQNASSRVGRTATRKAPEENGSRGVSVGDSPRMNSSGKIVFHSLERSSSSPSSFNGGPRMKTRGMERSYSANVRIRPVLNVPVCSLRGSSSSKSGSGFGFGQFFSSQKRDGGAKNKVTKRNANESNR
ncbi:hypothetical protein IFM89_013220 [Coptis chinensis]|uniref:Uncharacterized protein n=1 Tax=Coptis chinensis TaxID=261450 RepID=A0A835IKC2_9MAGN|nr:hypothetical protein IFM89_013220 [Coptis chinensis]